MVKHLSALKICHFFSHISSNRTIGFLRCNIHSCPKEVKAAAYTTLVRPSIEYASSVWDPYTQNNIHQLEAIQRRAARFVYNNFYDREPRVVTSMISRLQWESLEQRRAKARATGDDGTREERISIYFSIGIQCSVGCITSGSVV
jgi:hypothetical protein